MPDICLKVMSNLGLIKLSFAESFGFMFYGRNHCELSVVCVVVMQSIGMHDKVYIDAIGLVNNKSTVSMTIISDMELLTYVLEGQNFGDSIGIEPIIAVVGHMSFLGGCQCSTITTKQNR